MAPGDRTTYRCRSVVLTGVAWLAAGLALVTLAALLWAGPGDHVWESAAGVVAGAVMAVFGAGLLTSRLELGPDDVVGHWMFSASQHRLADLVDATMATPRGRGFRDHTGLAPSVVIPGGVVLVAVGYALVTVVHLLAWLTVPGSGNGEALHLIPRYGGPVPVLAIWTRIDRPSDRAHHVLAAVQAAIAARAPERWAVGEEPPAWQRPLPPLTNEPPPA